MGKKTISSKANSAQQTITSKRRGHRRVNESFVSSSVSDLINGDHVSNTSGCQVCECQIGSQGTLTKGKTTGRVRGVHSRSRITRERFQFVCESSRAYTAK
jgi:hypothetical protein